MKKTISLLALSILLCGLGFSVRAEAAASVQEIMENMTLRQKVGQLFIVRPDALDFSQTQEQIDNVKEQGVTELTEGMRTALEEYPVAAWRSSEKTLKARSSFSGLPPS